MSDSTGARASDLERRLATILSADVAEYSRLMAEDEEGTLRVFRGHSEVFEKLVALHRGRIFNTAGDAILAEFGSAVEAVRCATEIQAALRTRNDQLPERRQVQFRIGVNLGDVMVQGHDLLGDGVNIAARLQTAAAAGGICISGGVYDQIRNRLSLGFRPMGDMSFKNIPQPVRTFSIVEAEGLGELPSPSADPASRGFSRRPIPIAAAVVLLLILLAGGVWLSSNHEQRDGGVAGTATVKPAAIAALAPATAESRTSAAPAVVAAPAEPPPAAVRHPGNDDGAYIGPLCFGATQTLPATCFPVQVTLEQGSFSGQWAGRDQAVTWHLAGDVSASGHVTIRVHGEKADGARLAAVDFSGTLHDGVVDATGEFANGRSATLNWRKREENQAAAPATATLAPTPPAGAIKPPATPATLGRAIEGLYAGQICYGASLAESPRCFRARGKLQQGRLSGEWPGRDAGVTMHLEGEVLPSGVVSIRMHADDAGGARRATINLTGTLRDGKIDATGNFLNGRSATLNWSKN